MRRMGLLAVVLAVAAAGCGAAGSGHGPIEFGLTGGNVVAYKVTIQPNGSVRVRGSGRTARRQIPPAEARRQRGEIHRANLGDRRCAGVLPDIASRFIRAGGRTVTVHGACEAGFERVWNDLVRAVSLRSG